MLSDLHNSCEYSLVISGMVLQLLPVWYCNATPGMALGMGYGLSRALIWYGFSRSYLCAGSECNEERAMNEIFETPIPQRAS
ncbi:hypothetical protein SUGI_0956440 [Cryptomeria japonica]|nr:hypothetical protein SUGI_0956440 [Cryptomeria japonica]